jgi:hypothetical protein
LNTRTSVIVHRPNRYDGDTYRGCLKSVGRWRTLLVSEYDGYGGVMPEIPAAAGRYAGVLVFEGEHYGSGRYWIDIVNLHTGRHRGELVLGNSQGMSGPRQLAITSLVISPYATIGWIALEYWDYTATPNPSWTLLAHDASGTRPLDSGESDKSLADLRFRRATLHWTHDGAPRASTLGTK